jgi:hypothetical protein
MADTHNKEEFPPTFDLVIEAGRGFGRHWGDLWRYRELFYFLAWRMGYGAPSGWHGPSSVPS